MINYKQRLYEFVEERRRSPNRKLFRAWILYLEQMKVEDGKCMDYIEDFMEYDDFFKGKKQQTINNYKRELRLFSEYVNEVEGYKALVDEPAEEVVTENISSLSDEMKEANKGRIFKHEVSEPVKEDYDEEYKEFLRKYEKLTGIHENEKVDKTHVGTYNLGGVVHLSHEYDI